MRLPRRKFLKTGMLSAISAGLALSAGRVVAQKQRTPIVTSLDPLLDLPVDVQIDPVASFKPETFKPYIGGVFTAPNARGEKIELKLLSVANFKHTKSTKGGVKTESFSLTFQADAELSPFTSIYKINHPSLGDFQLFLTNHTNESGELLYHAVINHLL
ncbi:MAG TPA: hypothetical protein VF251_04950 [Pyrinomonadaceae bacterium]